MVPDRDKRRMTAKHLDSDCLKSYMVPDRDKRRMTAKQENKKNCF
jgi:hypothetical protein